jgi:hypothetical protein
MRLVIATALALTAANVFGPSAHAGLINIVNQGFETPATITTAAPSGWTLINTGGGGGTSTVGSYNPYEYQGGNAYYTGANATTDPANGGSGYPGIFGENLAFANNVSAGSGLQQTLTATLLLNTVYTFTVEEGNRNGRDAGGFAGSLIELLAGSTVIASSTDTVGPTAGTFRDQVAFLANSNSFSALVGQTLSIEILTTNTAAENRASDWDNVRLDASPAAVPEPASIFMVFTAATAVGACQLIRRRKSAARRA